MAERNIKILVRDKKALVEGGPVIVCGNSDYTITFDFDDDWSPAGVRTVRFVYVRGGQVHHQDVVFEGTTASVPVLSGITSVKVGVFEGDLSTTTPASIRCKESILCGTGKPEDPTPDVYDQIMALFDSLADQGAFGATEEQARQIEANRAGIEALVNGTTPAGNATNAEKLGDKEASAYVTTAGNGNVNGNIRLEKEGSSEVAYLFGNGERLAKLTIINGQLGIYDYTNQKWVFVSEANGAITFNGTASGNLPLSGGELRDRKESLITLHNSFEGETSNKVNIVFKLRNAILGLIGFKSDGTNKKPYVKFEGNSTEYELLHSGNAGSYALPLDGGGKIQKSGYDIIELENTAYYNSFVAFRGTNGRNGAIGFLNVNRPVIMNDKQDTFYDMLHTGNSAATKVQASAPSDTTAVWVW